MPDAASCVPWGRATTIYFPTHLSPQLQSAVGREALINTPRCQAPFYQEAVANMQHGLLIYNVKQIHWVVFYMAAEQSTLKIFDMHHPPL